MTLSADDWAVRRLNAHSFETIWNGAAGEYTVNVPLQPIGTRFSTGTVVVGNTTYGLPDASIFVTFAIPYRLAGNPALLPYDTWLSSDVVLANVQSLISVYSEPGLMLPRNCVFLYRSKTSALLLVAVRYAACTKLFGTTIPSLYLTVYRNPRRDLPISSTSYYLNTPLSTSAIAAIQTYINTCLSKNNAGTIVYQNGYEIDVSQSIPAFNGGDYIDVLFDLGIIAAYDAPILNLNSGYMSLFYQGPRDILHCPKALNPINLILTHEASHLSLWDSTTRRGVTIPRLDPFCVEQISHADWSINRTVTEALKTGLGSIEVLVHVRIRQPAKPNVLQPNAALLQALYECSDVEIVENLQGSIDSDATFWTAAALEQSAYVNLLFSSPSATATDTTVLTTYRNALGYHDMAALLGAVVQTNLKAQQSIVIRKPVSLFNNNGYAMVFKSGVKLDSAKVSLLDLPFGKLAIGIDPSISVLPSDTFDIAFTENANPIVTTVVAAANTATIAIASPYASVYEVVNFNNPLVGWNATLTQGYTKLAAGNTTYQIYPATSGTGYEVVISPSLYGKTILVTDDIFVSTNRVDLDPIISSVAPLIFPLQIQDTTGNLVPLLNSGMVEVYINGLRLAYGLDFVLMPWTDPQSGAIGHIDVVVSNKSFLNLQGTGNYLEIIAHSSIQSSQDVSYVLGQTLRNEVTPSFWHPDLSRCVIEGLWDDTVQYHTDWFSVSNQPEGGVGYWDTVVPRRVYELMKNYDAVSDYTNRAIVDKVLRHIIPPLPVQVVLTSQHSVYSPYLAAIIADVISGKLILVDEPDPRMFLRQFSAYAALKAIDPSLATYAGPINISYVAVSAHYANYTIATPSTATLINKLVTLTLTPTPTLGENLV